MLQVSVYDIVTSIFDYIYVVIVENQEIKREGDGMSSDLEEYRR